MSIVQVVYAAATRCGVAVADLELQKNYDVGEGQARHGHCVGEVELEDAERSKRARL